MPKFHFPSKEERESLIRQMRELTTGQNQNLTSLPEYQKYIQSMKALDDMMADCYQPDENGIPKALTKEDSERLQEAIIKTAHNGEAFLATAIGNYNANPNQGLPGVVDKLQNLLSKDFDALSNYDPASHKSLPEMQLDAKTLSINLKDRNLGTMSNLSSSRIPLTVVNSQGKKRTGVFTKASHVKTGNLYDQIIVGAKQHCNDEGKAALDRIIDAVKEKTIEIGLRKLDGSRVSEQNDRTFFIGFLLDALHTAQLTPEQRKKPGFVKTTLQEKTVKSVLKKYGVDPDKISSQGMKALTKGLDKMGQTPVYTILGTNLELNEGDRLDIRNTAMSKIAGLLGASKLLARSDNMKMTDQNGNTIEGTFMDYGEGVDLMGKPGALAAISSEPLDSKDANKTFLKQVADMQVLDFLCMNTDRHPGNLVYKIDEFGKISGIQGIDNDSAFCRRAINLNQVKDLTVISESMRDKIMNLTPEIIKFLLRGTGLSEQELNMTSLRLGALQSAIRNKELNIVNDKDFGNYKIDDFYPKQEGRKNLFSSLGRIPQRVKNAVENYGRKTLSDYTKKPEFGKVSTNDRNFTVGGIRDSIGDVSRLVHNKETNFKLSDLHTIRGRSEAFKNLMNAVQHGETALKQVAFEKDRTGQPMVDDYVHLNELPALRVLKKADPVFEDMAEKANLYLAEKMRKKHVNSPEELVGKNAYEQSHIDFAKKVLETVRKYNERTAEPTNEAEKEDIRAKDDRQLIENIRDAREQDKKHQEQKKSEESNLLRI